MINKSTDFWHEKTKLGQKWDEIISCYKQKFTVICSYNCFNCCDAEIKKKVHKTVFEYGLIYAVLHVFAGRSTIRNTDRQQQK